MTPMLRTSGMGLLCLAFAGCVALPPPSKPNDPKPAPLAYETVQPLLDVTDTPEIPDRSVAFSPDLLASCVITDSHLSAPDQRSVEGLAVARGRELELKLRCAEKHAALAAEARYVQAIYPEACYGRQ